jgi:ATP-dependent 26S proteasome regulatory subunit
MSFSNYIGAGYPLLWVSSFEEYRVLTSYVADMFKAKDKYTTVTWDVADGLKEVKLENGTLKSSKEPIRVHVTTANGETEEVASNMDPLIPLTWLDEKAEENTILFLKDYTPFLEKSCKDSILLSRKMRNLISKFKAQGKTLVVLSPEVKIPVELEKEITVVEFKLPTREELSIVLKGVCESTGAPYPKDTDMIIDSALGMTAFEAENAFCISLIEAKKFEPSVIRREKSSIVRKSGLLEITDTSDFSIEDIGGMENVKKWTLLRKDCSSAKARAFGITPAKGLLLVGVPGCGKSLFAKVIATIRGQVLVRLDMGRIFGSYVGESESNMRKVLTVLEAISPCVVWLDELEKSMSGNKAGHEGHETTRRVFQEFLTWMQEKKADCLLVATANSVESLPPELIRPGRIDKMFFVDLPDEVQRAEIFRIHLRKAGRKPDMFDSKMDVLMGLCKDFTGAEIEVWVKDSLVTAYAAGHDNVTLEDLKETVTEITPIIKLMAKDIQNARVWAEQHGAKPASIKHEKASVDVVPLKARKISMGGNSNN